MTADKPDMFSLDAHFMLDAFSKAHESAISNYDAAVALAESGRHAQATSIAIAALEEIGKMMLIDDLLFARTGGKRYQRHYKDGQLAHHVKLDALELYPHFLNSLITADPRRNEMGYKHMMATVCSHFNTKRQKLADLFRQDFVFLHLGALKQQGLCSHEADRAVRANREAVNLEVSKAILALAGCITDAFRLVLGPSLEHYRILFRDLQEKGYETYLETIRGDATEIFKGVFGSLEDERP
jgi:AbiV family abortive infection protein